MGHAGRSASKMAKHNNCYIMTAMLFYMNTIRTSYPQKQPILVYNIVVRTAWLPKKQLSALFTEPNYSLADINNSPRHLNDH